MCIGHFRTYFQSDYRDFKTFLRKYSDVNILLISLLYILYTTNMVDINICLISLLYFRIHFKSLSPLPKRVLGQGICMFQKVQITQKHKWSTIFLYSITTYKNSHYNILLVCIILGVRCDCLVHNSNSVYIKVDKF